MTLDKNKQKNRLIRGTTITWTVIAAVSVLALVLTVFFGDRLATLIVGSSSVPAGSGATFTSTASKTTVNQGEAFYYTVTMNAQANTIYSATTYIDVDESKFTIDAIHYADGATAPAFNSAFDTVFDKNGGTTAFFDNATGIIQVNFTSTTGGVTGSGKNLVRVDLTAKAAATPGTSIIAMPYTARQTVCPPSPTGTQDGPNLALDVETISGTDVSCNILDGTTQQLTMTIVQPQPTPTVSTVSPASVTAPFAGTQSLSITGTNFTFNSLPVTAQLVSGSTTKNLTITSNNGTTIAATYDSTGLPAATYNVVVTVGSVAATKTNAFVVNQLPVPDAPTIRVYNSSVPADNDPTIDYKYKRTSTKVTFEWKVDGAQLKNSTIDRYEYKFYQTGTSEPASWTTLNPATATTITITGLHLVNGRNYTFKVRSHNPAGYNAADTVFTFTTQTANLDYAVDAQGKEVIGAADLNRLITRWNQAVVAGTATEEANLTNSPSANILDQFDLSILVSRYGSSL